MFKIGDAVVHPAHGAGVVKSIEVRHVLGNDEQYFVLHLPLENVDKVLVPVKNCTKIGLRKTVNKKTIAKVLKILKSRAVKLRNRTEPWAKLYRRNLNKIKSGNIIKVAEVLKELYEESKVRVLGMQDNELIRKAKRILISEVAMVKRISTKEATDIINESLTGGI